MFNAMINGIDPKQQQPAPQQTTTTLSNNKSKPLGSGQAAIDESIFANIDMDEFAPTSKKQQQSSSTKPNNGLSSGKKTTNPLDDLFQDELLAGILAATNNTTTTSHSNTNLQTSPVQTKSKPVVAKKNSISANRYDDLFSGLNGQKTVKQDGNMDWLGGLEYEGSFLTREEANSTKGGGGGLRRSRFIPSGKRDGNSAAGSNKNAAGGAGGGGWTQTTFKINTGPMPNNQVNHQQGSPTNGGSGAGGAGAVAVNGAGGYVPSFTTSAANKNQTDKKSIFEILKFFILVNNFWS